MLVAIQPDNYGPGDASSPIWTRLLREAGHSVREVNVYHADILEQVHGCDGFMWRHIHWPDHQQIAHRLLPVLENTLHLTVYPDQKTGWHYDDKIAQSYLLPSAGIPTPATWVWFDRDAAHQWLKEAPYPLILKLSGGAGSQNVLMVNNEHEAGTWVDLLFSTGASTLTQSSQSRLSIGRTRLSLGLQLLLHGTLPPPLPGHSWEVHRNYALFQEYLPDNSYDTRVTVIGDRAFGFRRLNRDGDFRASGSGKLVYDPKGVDPAFIALAFKTASALGTQSCAIDGLWRNGQPVVGEISYTYVSHCIHDCPGHWDSGMAWHNGNMWPEEAQIEDYLCRLESRKPQRATT